MILRKSTFTPSIPHNACSRTGLLNSSTRNNISVKNYSINYKNNHNVISSLHNIRNYTNQVTIENEDQFDFKKIMEQKYPKQDRIQPVEYSGPETLRVAYVMDRIPIVSRDDHPVEMAWSDYSQEIQSEKAKHKFVDFWEFLEKWKPVFEQQQKEEKKTKKKKKKKKQEETKEVRGPDKWIKVADPEESQLKKSRWSYKTGEKAKEEKQHVQSYRPLPRFTQDDFDDNRYSLVRQLHRRLFFIVRDSKTGKWQFPSAIRSNPLTMRQAAEKLHKEHFEDYLDAYFISNAPIGHWVNPEDSNDMTFFYHCLYKDGFIPDDTWDDWALVTRRELREYDMPKGYRSIAEKMLLEGYETVGK